MRPYTSDHGLRHYHDEEPPSAAPSRGWLWLVLLVGVIVVADLVIAQWLKGAGH